MVCIEASFSLREYFAGFLKLVLLKRLLETKAADHWCEVVALAAPRSANWRGQRRRGSIRGRWFAGRRAEYLPSLSPQGVPLYGHLYDDAFFADQIDVLDAVDA